MSKLQRIYNLISRIKKVSTKSKKNLFWVIKDYIGFRKSGKVSFQEYENYRLYIKDKQFRSMFLSYAKAEQYWEILNPRKYACLARDKYLGHCLLEEVGIPTSTLIAYYNPELASAKDKEVYSYDQLSRILTENEVSSFVIKPATDSAHGDGVLICRELIRRNGDLIIKKTNGEEIPLKQVLHSTPLLFEAVITQAPPFAELNRSSLNTIRVMTALYPDHTVKIFAAFLKIGRAGSDVDNAGRGGNVDCGVSVETGQLYNAVQFNSWTNIEPISVHPDSKVKIDGQYIKDWDKIKNRLEYFQGLIPQLKTIGWDVAITDEGPIIVEINNWWDTTGQEFIGKGWEPEVKECYDAWVRCYSKG